MSDPQRWNPMSTVPKDGSWFMIGIETNGKIEWSTSASWSEEWKSFYNFVHSNPWKMNIDNPKFVGWLPMYNKSKAKEGRDAK